MRREYYRDDGLIHGGKGFSVDNTLKVRFSKSNLKYKPSENVFSLSNNQYEFYGDANKNISPTYDGWIDLFGYGTSSYDNKYPYMSDGATASYYNGNITGTEYDWGSHNSILNADTSKGFFRTLTRAELAYIVFTRGGVNI